MKKTEFPMSALEIMRACLVYSVNNSEKDDSSGMAEQYLNKIDSIINGETVLMSSADFFELHKFVITIFASILDNGKVTDNKWTDKQWDNVLQHIEKCYDGTPKTFEVSRMIK